ncbi:hypothetical protein [Sediminibacillus massiliensis]|uniref:hypothetical protein n=1 Tax=Sediminibacillus massiliensis TaxID=1926277 RepID=UPI000988358B|nr:hypothetical protein [Sediminibacillus massiliensis]
MKKSIRGRLKAKTQADKDSIVKSINKYELWKLDTQDFTGDETAEPSFNFEAWVNTETDKNNLFSDMKKKVDELSGEIDWHDCTHDEKEKKPCKIAEKYEKKVN